MKSLIEELSAILNPVEEEVEAGREETVVENDEGSDDVVEEVVQEKDEEGENLSDVVESIISGEIDESRGGFDAGIGKIAKLVSRNEHAKAFELGAKLIGAKKMEKKMSLIGNLQDLDGFTDSNLERYRKMAEDDLMRMSKDALSGEQYDAFKGAF